MIDVTYQDNRYILTFVEVINGYEFSSRYELKCAENILRVIKYLG